MSANARSRVAVVGGMRTPFVKAGTVFAELSALELGTHAVRGLIEALDVDPGSIDELVFGTVIPNPLVSNIAREIVFEAGLPETLHAHAVSNNCITGIHAVTSVAESISSGRTSAGIAGGAESMSSPPILFGPDASAVLRRAQGARSFGGKLAALSRLRPRHLKPTAPGVAERSTGLSMGEHCELMAKEWDISRQEQDEIAYASHMNARKGFDDGHLAAEIVALRDVRRDLTVRPDTTREKLAALPAVFDRGPAGTISAGNSSPLTDGAAAVLLMSEQRARREGREPLAFIRGFEFAAIDPADGLLMAPAVAVPRLLRREGLTLADMDVIEMHEAFGAQVAANIRAWERGWKEPAIGEVDRSRLNPLGSSIAVGHPFAATGGRIVTTLANHMHRSDARYGLISVCAAGAMAAALILERT